MLEAVAFPDEKYGSSDFMSIHHFLYLTAFGAKNYFWQDYICAKRSGEPFGGLRGVVWRSVKEIDVVDEDNVCSIGDARFMFKIANRLVNSTQEEKDDWLDILDGIMERHERKSSCTQDLFIVPRNEYEAKKTISRR